MAKKLNAVHGVFCSLYLFYVVPGSLFCKLHLANEEALTVFCSVVEHAGGRVEDERSV